MWLTGYFVLMPVITLVPALDIEVLANLSGWQ